MTGTTAVAWGAGGLLAVVSETEAGMVADTARVAMAVIEVAAAAAEVVVAMVVTQVVVVAETVVVVVRFAPMQPQIRLARSFLMHEKARPS